jgi:ABC-type antimicrobial peptide transport system permease subunit
MIPRVAALSTVGAVLGVAIMVAIGALIFGSSAQGIELQAPEKNVLTITSGDRQSAAGRGAVLTTADVDAIASNVPDIASLSRAVFGTALVAAGGQDEQTRVEGVDPSFAQVTNSTVTRGTSFSDLDGTSANRVAVLGQAISSQMFGTGQTPVGATILIRSVPYTVIGVLSPQPGPDDTVLIPFQTGQIRLFGATALDAVLVQVTDPNRTDTVRQQLEQLLRQRHQVRPGQPAGFTISTNPSAPSDVTTKPAEFLGRVVQLVRQYGCEAKGLCARAPR